MAEKHLVCQGAVCQCIFGSSSDTLQVNTRPNHYINDTSSEKATATTVDIGKTFKNNSFGSCSQRKGNPCIVTVTKWNNYYKNVTLHHTGKVLLEDSTADCPVGGVGCIRIIFHGQQPELSKSNFYQADPALHEVLNPVGDIEEIQQKTEDIYDAY